MSHRLASLALRDRAIYAKREGRPSGWGPCHLEVKRSDSLCGDPAEPSYASVRVVRAARFGGAHPSRYR